ncbi:MAG: carboxypeptidase regulatory-like domain-containing protein, partial [Gammaproteobacteria bacterium]|nr:carboxypeptidase regulatory-like domain-containing protein [Gammaproteobacteria bacterium]
MYSVEISGYDTDEYEFAITSKDVTVGVGEVVDVVFEGVLLGTSGIAGRVSAGGTGIADVTVTVSADGMGDVTTTTDAGGLYGFAGLSAGDYTVSISGYDTDDYEFEVTSKDVTVARDRTLIVDFEGRAGGGSNQSPVTVGTIPATTLKAGESVTVNASSYFSDPDGDALTYTASSSRTSVATASVSGSVVTVNAVAQGNATIRITARDPVGLSAAQTFSVTVGGTGRDGECVRGATYARGESCDVYGTGSSSKLTFTVLSDGRARLGFITAGNRITVKGTVNGVRYHFVASHQGGGIWRIDEYIP